MSKGKIRIGEIKEKETFQYGQVLKSTGVTIIPVRPNGEEEPAVEVSFNEIVPEGEIKTALKDQGYEVIEEEKE